MLGNTRYAMSWAIFVLVALVGSTVPGCIWAESTVQMATFSPDGSMAACQWTDTVTIGPPFAPAWRADASQYVLWVPATGGQAQAARMCRISGASVGMQAVDGDAVTGIAFSPDSKYLAIAKTKQISLLDAATGQTNRVSPMNCRATSVAWPSEREIAYTTNDDGLLIWQQSIDDLPEDRRIVYNGASTDQALHCGLAPGMWESRGWSPNGQWLLLAGLGQRSELALLDVVEGKTHPIDKELMFAAKSIWREDSEELLCVSASKKGALNRSLRAKLVQLDPFEVVDISNQFQEILQDNALIRLIGPWTSDRGITITVSGDASGNFYSLQPSPWVVSPTDDPYAFWRKHVGSNGVRSRDGKAVLRFNSKSRATATSVE